MHKYTYDVRPCNPDPKNHHIHTNILKNIHLMRTHKKNEV